MLFGEVRPSAPVRRAYVGSGPCNCFGICNLAGLENYWFHLVPVYCLQKLQALRAEAKASNKSPGMRLELIKMRSASMPPSAPVKKACSGRWRSFSLQQCLQPMLSPGQSALRLSAVVLFCSRENSNKALL